MNTIVSTEDYQLQVKKTWVESTKQWHIQFFKKSVWETKFEFFLNETELTKLKELL